ncbi:MAG: SDR family NAD(P)-dependent oxidoreductase [Solirubrobacteraceae bacterium]
MPSVLVTGAGRGIGRTVALHMAQGGWEVYAGVRRPEDAEALSQEAGITPVLLDITDAAQVAELRSAVGQRLDAVVNNAGVVVRGPVEGLAIDDLRRQFEVNLVSQVAVTQAVLPMLRTSRGRVVFMSSISGRVSTPFMGAYAGSKFALEGLADALRIELRPWGIRVTLVEPGSIDTDLWRNVEETTDEVEAGLSADHRRLYARQIAAMRKLSARVAKQAAPPATVAAAVERALSADRPRARYLVGADAKIQLALGAVIPPRFMDAAVGRMTGGR